MTLCAYRVRSFLQTLYCIAESPEMAMVMAQTIVRPKHVLEPHFDFRTDLISNMTSKRMIDNMAIRDCGEVCRGYIDNSLHEYDVAHHVSHIKDHAFIRFQTREEKVISLL